jgi:hypothetical protein
MEENALSSVDLDCGGGGSGGFAAKGGGGGLVADNIFSVSNLATKPSRSVVRSEMNERTRPRSLDTSPVSSV